MDNDISTLGLEIFDALEKGVSYELIEKAYFKDMKCQDDVDYNNTIIREINKHFLPNQYKLSEYFGLMFLNNE